MGIENIFRKFYKHFIVFIFTFIVGISFIEFGVQQQKNRYLEMQTQLLDTKYKTNYKYFHIMSKDIFEMYQEDKRVISVLTQAYKADTTKKDILRNELYTKLKKRYKRLKNMGVLQLHFHMPNNTSFLRMHKPEKFGDNLSAVRESVKLANKTKKAQNGFEIGKLTHGFRFVYPLFNKNIHIGSMEISFSSKKLINSILDNFMIDSHFLVSKEEIDKSIFKNIQESVYQQSLESEDFLLEKATHNSTDNKTILKTILNKASTEKISKTMQKGIAFSVSGTYNHETTVGSFVPIKNIHNAKTIAYLAVYTESDYLDNLMMEEKYIKMLLLTIIFLLFIFSIYATFTRDKLEKMAHFDELTALPNRAYFYIELEHELKRAKRLKQKLAIMFIDLDGFKEVNDSYGHDTGDNLLIDVAQRLRKSVRDTDIIARLGGDEFTVVLSSVKYQEDMELVAKKIIDKLSEEFIINKQVINISASIGISIYPENGEDSDTLIKQSDNAMYLAKDNGKNCFIIQKEN